MGLFGRRRSAGADASGEPDPDLPMFSTGERAVRFVALARTVFAEHGLECSYHDGFLRGTDGRNYGLTNVALLAVQGPERHWRALLDQHVAGIVAAHATPKQRDLAAVRHRLYLRLWPTDELPVRAPVEAIGEPLGQGLVGLASIDHPEHVETLAGGHDIALLGGWPRVREVALRNLARLRAEDVFPLGDDPASRVHLSVGGFFNASRVLTMRQLLGEDLLVEAPTHGVLFAAPNRHLVALHPVEGPGARAALDLLVGVASREYDVPGAISPQVWYWHDGRVEQVTRTGGAGVEPDLGDGELARVLRDVDDQRDG